MAFVNLRFWDYLNGLLTPNVASHAGIQADTPPSIAFARGSAKLPVCIPR